MSGQSICKAISGDGTEISARVQGQGPALLFVHGGLGDDESWRFTVPLLADRFTCHSMSTRGRGLSEDNPDHSRRRLVEDIAALAEKIGGPVGLVGHSSGGALALEAAAQSDAVAALGLYEPTIFSFAGETRDSEHDQKAFARIGSFAMEGRLEEAAQVFLEDLALANEQELEALSKAEAARELAPTVPAAMQEAAQSGPPDLSDVALLERVTQPVLLVVGSSTHPFYVNVVEELVGRLAKPLVRTIGGAGHIAPVLAPEPVAEELGRFFTEVQGRA